MAKRVDSSERVYRYDQGELAPPTVTPEGFLIAEGVIARAGVLHYVHPDGTVTRELVLPEELAAPASLATLSRKPTTIEHPPEYVTSDNVRQYAVGDVGDAPRFVPDDAEGGSLRAMICVRDREGIELVKDGDKRGLSPGYTCRIDPTPGNHPVFGPYDAIQRDRVYNHVAHTDSPRGGPTVRLRVDSAYQIDPGKNMLTRAYLLSVLTAFGLANRADALLPEPEEGESDEDVKIDVAALKGVLDALIGVHDVLKAKVANEDESDDEQNEDESDDEQNEDESDDEQNEDESDDERSDSRKRRNKRRNKRRDSKRVDPLAYFRERLPLVKLAEELRIDSDKLDNPALKRAIVRSLNENAPARMSEAYADAYIDAHRSHRVDTANQWGAGKGNGSGYGPREDAAPSPTEKALNRYQTAFEERAKR